MTEREVKRLRRTELIEMLFYLQKEMEMLQVENASLHRQLEAKKAGLSDQDMNKIFEVVKSAVHESIQSSVGEPVEIVRDSE